MAFVEPLGDRIVAAHLEPDVVNTDVLGIDVLVGAKAARRRSRRQAWREAC
jgi:hypothetical protein